MMTNRKLQIALFALLIGIGCSDDTDTSVDDVGTEDVAEAVDSDFTDADTSDQRPEFIDCYDLKPDECRMHLNEANEEDPFKCRIMFLRPFDHEAKCFDTSQAERHCVFHKDIGDNSTDMLLSPEGNCYWHTSTAVGHPPGWQIAQDIDRSEVPEVCRENEGIICAQ